MTEITPQPEAKPQLSWTQKQVYTMSAICVVLGLVFGYFLRGSEGASAHTRTDAATQSQPQQGMPPQMGEGGGQPMPSLDDMKRMADKAAEPLLAQLKSDPKNPQLLVKIGSTYKSAHQFKEAAKYFGQALEQNPKDLALRNETGADFYYAGDVDQAIAIFQDGLKYSPNDPATLLNLGMIKLRKKNDPKGAVELWKQLLATNPSLEPQKKQQIEKLIADAQSGKPLASN
ncbi:Tetratricopeptide repeat protein [Candidatus Koribacter versatilis Ellin345]|uniref:Tetratricopeptide repeat protein n=1 Tax=Koribacter versatilis (strain Ellin345) TaxID=204669 RepID=Q1ITQ8_KORVE|nr:tetratricopeptide repeat protein [Candidatus Koribacter versatilis]ABF39742.1 Tetratricopeptide repeat protein [Candidatus Koribacter versatilis Ellin345]